MWVEESAPKETLGTNVFVSSEGCTGTIWQVTGSWVPPPEEQWESLRPLRVHTHALIPPFLLPLDTHHLGGHLLSVIYHHS